MLLRGLDPAGAFAGRLDTSEERRSFTRNAPVMQLFQRCGCSSSGGSRRLAGPLRHDVASASDYAVNCSVQEPHIWSKGQPYCSTSASCGLSGHPCSIRHPRCSTGNPERVSPAIIEPAMTRLSLCVKPSF